VNKPFQQATVKERLDGGPIAAMRGEQFVTQRAAEFRNGLREGHAFLLQQNLAR
jgi:hypothetical protein